MTNIYDRFDAATKNITAVALLKGGNCIGRVVIKHGAAATAFVHITGSQMASGQARGGGYDKSSAAVRIAIAKLDPGLADLKREALIQALQDAEKAAGSGDDWTSIVSEACITVANVI